MNEEQSTLEERKQACTDLLKRIDSITTRKEYMELVATLLQMAIHNLMMQQPAMEPTAIANVLIRHASEEEISYSKAARKSADSLQNMFKGLFELEAASESGKDVTIQDIIKKAEEAAHG